MIPNTGDYTGGIKQRPLKITAYVEPELKSALVISAERNSRKISAELNLILKKHFAASTEGAN